MNALSRTNISIQSLREMDTADLHEFSQAALSELRTRDQIAYATWTQKRMDDYFDSHCTSLDLDLLAMQPHRHAFRKFALRKINSFIMKDASLNTRVKRELTQWLRNHVDTVAAPAIDDDWRGHFASLAESSDATKKL